MICLIFYLQVRLATQTLSSSVADAIEFCADLGFVALEQSAATVFFIRIFDRIFDALNSRRPSETGFKAPLSKDNLFQIEELFAFAEEFICSLELQNGLSVVTSLKKTGFIGFIFCMRSFINLGRELLHRDESPFKYVLAYKFSQDNLELLFNFVRGTLGWNTNPSAKQMCHIFRRLHARIGIVSDSTGNCVSFSDDTHDKDDNDDDDITPLPIFEEDDNEDIHTAYRNNVIPYIAGFVVRKFMKHDSCGECRVALIDSAGNSDVMAEDRHFLRLKNNGGLVQPSNGVVKVLRRCETIYRELPLKRRTPHALYVHVMNALPSDVFSETHFNDVFGHRLRLISSLVKIYVEMRSFHVARMENLSETNYKRSRLTRYIVNLSQ